MSARAHSLAPRHEVGRVVADLVGGASVEIGSVDFPDFAGACTAFAPGRRIFVSHLPGQAWRSTFEMCTQIAARGFEPIPHVPVRLLEDAGELDSILRRARDAGVRQPLLISGDYPAARGPFSTVIQVLQTGALQSHGFAGVLLAGHPEGHPRAPWDVICEAQIDKWRVSSTSGLRVTFVTQFFFEAKPFVDWARLLRAAGVEARLVAGVAGPTGLGRLIKLARHCGVGASLRLLTSRPAAAMRLFGEHAPDGLLSELAAEKLAQPTLFDGLHLFSLGGVAQTVAWLRRAGAPIA